ncbi:MAG: hypothetical protein HFI69_11110 [Lachnospiraceae bacterium]|nr:hypothetical protein [Lachnospiraceae bacterium]
MGILNKQIRVCPTNCFLTDVRRNLWGTQMAGMNFKRALVWNMLIKEPDAQIQHLERLLTGIA